jgi:hypothetical protein
MAPVVDSMYHPNIGCNEHSLSDIDREPLPRFTKLISTISLHVELEYTACLIITIVTRIHSTSRHVCVVVVVIIFIARRRIHSWSKPRHHKVRLQPGLGRSTSMVVQMIRISAHTTTRHSDIAAWSPFWSISSKHGKIWFAFHQGTRDATRQSWQGVGYVANASHQINHFPVNKMRQNLAS